MPRITGTQREDERRFPEAFIVHEAIKHFSFERRQLFFGMPAVCCVCEAMKELGLDRAAAILKRARR